MQRRHSSAASRKRSEQAVGVGDLEIIGAELALVLEEDLAVGDALRR